MPTQRVIFSIETVPGDPPMVVEQPNGDLLVPASVRQLAAEALERAESALDPGSAGGLEAFRRAKRLLALDAEALGWPLPEATSLPRNLLREYPLK
jgi:hypothetical protein